MYGWIDGCMNAVYQIHRINIYIVFWYTSKRTSRKSLKFFIHTYLFSSKEKRQKIIRLVDPEQQQLVMGMQRYAYKYTLRYNIFILKYKHT